MQSIYIDKTNIGYNDKKAYPVFRQMEEGGEFAFVYGDINILSDLRIRECTTIATNSKPHAEVLADSYPSKQVFLIEHPLNHGYKSGRANLSVVWCWDDFQFFVYFPSKHETQESL